MCVKRYSLKLMKNKYIKFTKALADLKIIVIGKMGQGGSITVGRWSKKKPVSLWKDEMVTRQKNSSNEIVVVALRSEAGDVV